MTLLPELEEALQREDALKQRVAQLEADNTRLVEQIAELTLKVVELRNAILNIRAVPDYDDDGRLRTGVQTLALVRLKAEEAKEI